MYALFYSKKALKYLKKLPKEKQKHIVSVIERVRIRPEVHVEKLVGEKAFKLRAGEYRIILDIVEDKLNILIIKIGHRKNIYK